MQDPLQIQSLKYSQILQSNYQFINEGYLIFSGLMIITKNFLEEIQFQNICKGNIHKLQNGFDLPFNSIQLILNQTCFTLVKAPSLYQSSKTPGKNIQFQYHNSFKVQTNGLNKITKLQSKKDSEANMNHNYDTTKESEQVYIHPTNIYYDKISL